MWVFPHLLKFTIHFIGSGGQPSRVFGLRPLSDLLSGTLCMLFSAAGIRIISIVIVISTRDL